MKKLCFSSNRPIKTILSLLDVMGGGTSCRKPSAVGEDHQACWVELFHSRRAEAARADVSSQFDLGELHLYDMSSETMSVSEAASRLVEGRSVASSNEFETRIKKGRRDVWLV